MRRGRLAPAVCEQCDDIFTRAVCDLARSAHWYCSRPCRDDAARTGKAYGEVACHGCGRLFRKLQCEIDRCLRHFCSPTCYQGSVDRRALGALGGAAPKELSPEFKFRRSQLAGLARARNLSPERLSEIGKIAARARLAKFSAPERSAISKRAALTRRVPVVCRPGSGSPMVLGVRLGKSS